MSLFKILSWKFVCSHRCPILVHIFSPLDQIMPHTLFTILPYFCRTTHRPSWSLSPLEEDTKGNYFVWILTDIHAVNDRSVSFLL